MRTFKRMIRPMCKEDVGEVAELAQQLGYPNTKDEIFSRFEVLKRLPGHQILVFSENGIKGFAHLEIDHDLIEETKVEVRSIVVEEKSRGRGIGQKLLNHAQDWAKSQGYPVIYLSCNIIRTSTHEFYKREGFKLVKTSHFFERGL